MFELLRARPLASGIIAVVTAVVGIAGGVLAWGPDRPTFTVANPADYVTFNSITDNPHVGDERDFVSVKDASNMQAGGWKDTINAEPGKEYLVRIYVHNNAAPNLNLKAINTRIQASIGSNTGTKVGLTGYISADNAKPTKVYDDVHFTSSDSFNLAYVPGSAILYNNVTGQAGRAVSDSIVDGSGAQIGYQSNNGEVPGCFEYASYITFKVKPQFAPKADFTIDKAVRKQGESSWHNSIETKPDDKIQYRVLFQNTSSVQMDSVMLFDTLPKGVSYTKGSTKLYLASDPKNARPMPDGITDKGLNIGSYGKNGLASVIFDAKVDSNKELPKCGVNTLKNVARAETDFGKKQDDATVKVSKECEEQPEPEVEKIKVCLIEDKKIVTIDKKDFDDSKHSTDLSKCEETPEVPEELPRTGATDNILAALGLGATVTATVAYIASRKNSLVG